MHWAELTEMRRTHFITALIIVASISTLFVIFQRRSSSMGCFLDGSRIDPLYAVTVIGKDKMSCNFACILSAQIWLMENCERISSVWVTDEMTGKKIKAEFAYYVESDIVTTPHTGNRIHVFALRTAAENHARMFSGKMLKNPLTIKEKRAVIKIHYGPDPGNSPLFNVSSTQKLLSMPGKTFLNTHLNFKYISQNFYHRLLRGYFSPPYKPPKNIA